MLDSQKQTHTFRADRDMEWRSGRSDHPWTYCFGAELSGGVPGAGEGMNNVETGENRNTMLQKCF